MSKIAREPGDPQHDARPIKYSPLRARAPIAEEPPTARRCTQARQNRSAHYLSAREAQPATAAADELPRDVRRAARTTGSDSLSPGRSPHVHQGAPFTGRRLVFPIFPRAAPIGIQCLVGMRRGSVSPLVERA